MTASRVDILARLERKHSAWDWLHILDLMEAAGLVVDIGDPTYDERDALRAFVRAYDAQMATPAASVTAHRRRRLDAARAALGDIP